jgi:hypothetical protein
LQQTTPPVYNYYDIVQDVKQKLQTCHEIAWAYLRQSKLKRVASQVGKVNIPTLQNGDKVLLRNEKAGKLDLPWVGPYTICEIDPSGSNVTLELSKKKKMKVHVNSLKV